MRTIEPHLSDAEPAALETRRLTVSYGDAPALKQVTMRVPRNRVVALIGPSGCGKTTLLRCLNRMNDLVTGANVEGQVLLNGDDVYGPGVDPVEVRRRVGMVFPEPNPFPRSVFENVAFGLRINGFEGDLNRAVEGALRRAALWDEVRNRLMAPAAELSGGQKQRLCIARALATAPEVILMDEPTAQLDPVGSQRIEQLIYELKEAYTILVVTHSMQQAARVSDLTAFLYMGELVEYGPTDQIFTNPREERTEAYVTGRFG